MQEHLVTNKITKVTNIITLGDHNYNLKVTNVIKVTNVRIFGHKCNKGHKCNDSWS